MNRTLFIKLLAMAMMLVMVGACGSDTKPPAGALKVSKATVQFGSHPKDTPAPAQTIDITNTSDQVINGIKYGLAGKTQGIFGVGGDCTSKLPAGATCQLAVDFTAKEASRVYSDAYNFQYDAKGGVDITSIKLLGNSVAAAYVPTGITSLQISKAKPVGNAGDTALEFNADDKLSSTVGIFSQEGNVSLRWLGAGSIKLNIDQPKDQRFRMRSSCAELTTGANCNIFFSFMPNVKSPSEIDNITIRTIQGTTSKNLVLNIEGSGTVPDQSTDISFSAVTKFGDTIVGQKSTSQDVTITSKAKTDLFYRLQPTSSAFSIVDHTCTGVLKAGASCTFKATYNATKVGAENAYIRFIAGKTAGFVPLIGTGTASIPAGTTIVTDLKQLDFPSTVVGLRSSTKRVVISGKTADTAKLSYVVTPSNYSQNFRFVTTCIDGAALSAGSSCTADIQFVPSDNTTIDTVKGAKFVIKGVPATASDTFDDVEVALTGTGLDAPKGADLATPIPGVTVSTKAFYFPDTAVGSISPAFQITVKNSNKTAVNGFASTSSSLIDFPLSTDFTTCTDTLAPNAECFIAYNFNSRDTAEKIAYISVWAGQKDDNNLIQMTAKGTLFNKYLSFGYVPAKAIKTLSMAFVNDRNATYPQIKTVDLTSFYTTWSWQKSDYWQVPSGATGKDYFNLTSFTNTNIEKDKSPFTISAEACSGTKLAVQESCIITVQFDQNNAKGSADGTYRAYVEIKGEDGKVLSFTDPITGETRLVGKFHVTASTNDNKTMYFPTDSIADGTPVINHPNTTAIIGAINFTIDERFFTFGGNAKLKPGTNMKMYDAARNMWTSIKPYAAKPTDSPLNSAGYGGAGVASYDSRVFLFGGTSKDKLPNGETLNTTDLYIYNPYETKNSIDGAWSKPVVQNTTPAKGLKNVGGVAAAALDGYIYFFGGSRGAEADPGRATYQYSPQFLALDVTDLANLKWINLTPDDFGAQQTAGKYPTSRSTTMGVYGGKIYLFGGSTNAHNVNGETAQFTQGQTLNDLWTFTPAKKSVDGKLVLDPENSKWERVAKNDPTTSTDTSDTFEDALYKAVPSPRNSGMVTANGNLYLPGSGISYQEKNKNESPHDCAWNDNTPGTTGDRNHYKRSKLMDKYIFQLVPDQTDKNAFKPFTPKDENDTLKLGRSLLYQNEADQQDRLGQYVAVPIVDIMWFHNVNIMGIYLASKQ